MATLPETGTMGFAIFDGEPIAGTVSSSFEADDGTPWVIVALVDGRHVQVEPDKFTQAA